MVYVAILPALFTTMFIFGSTSSLSNLVFANKLFVWIGKRSYSIYLVHWPAIVLWRISVSYEFGLIEKWFLVVASIAMGAFLYELVERKFRYTKLTTAKRRVEILLGTTILLGSVLLVCAHYWGNGGYPGRVPDELQEVASNLGGAWKKRTGQLRTGICNLQFDQYSATDYDRDICLGPHPTKPTWLVLGDSHASGAYLIFSKAYPNVHFNQLTIPGCRLRPTKRITGSKMCDELYNDMFMRLKDMNHITGVVIASNWVEGRVYEIEEVRNELRAAGKSIVLLNQRLVFKQSIPELVLATMGKAQATVQAQLMIDDKKRQLGITIRQRLSSTVPTIDIYGIQCPNVCDIFSDKGELLYLDRTHFSIPGINLMSQRISEKYPELLNAS